MMRRFSRTFWTDPVEQAVHAPLAGPNFDFPADAPAEPPDESPSATVLRSLHPAGHPVCVYVPEGYEPNYAYPLIVWLHGAGGSEHDLAKLMPGVSTRNYLGLAPRGPRPCGEGLWGWDPSDLPAAREALGETISRFRSEYHVHGERVYVAGFGGGGAAALRLLLECPDWFGGAAAFGGGLSRSETALSRYRQLRGKRVLLGAGSRDPAAPPAEVARTQRLLHAAGLSVTSHVYDADHQVTPRMLSHLNRWVMEGLGAVV